MNAIERSRSSLFLTGGSTQEIYGSANKLDEVDSKLREAADNAARYGQLTDRLHQVEIELEGLAAQRKASSIPVQPSGHAPKCVGRLE